MKCVFLFFFLRREEKERGQGEKNAREKENGNENTARLKPSPPKFQCKLTERTDVFLLLAKFWIRYVRCSKTSTFSNSLTTIYLEKITYNQRNHTSWVLCWRMARCVIKYCPGDDTSNNRCCCLEPRTKRLRMASGRSPSPIYLRTRVTEGSLYSLTAPLDVFTYCLWAAN